MALAFKRLLNDLAGRVKLHEEEMKKKIGADIKINIDTAGIEKIPGTVEDEQCRNTHVRGLLYWVVPESISEGICGSINHVGRDDLGKEAVKEGIKEVRVTVEQLPSGGTNSEEISLSNGVLHLRYKWRGDVNKWCAGDSSMCNSNCLPEKILKLL